MLRVGFLVFCIAIVVGSLFRVLILNPELKLGACRVLWESQIDSSVSNDTRSDLFEPAQPCFNTGLFLEQGRSYSIRVDIGKPWRDRDIPADIRGLGGWMAFHPILLAAIPTKRHLTLPWFSLVGEIGKDTGHVFPIKHEILTFTALASGELYLYVNDAVIPGAYENNSGSALVMVEPIEHPPW